jgi:predicted metal-dependent hydrolase
LPSLDLGDRRIEYSVVKGASRRYTYFRFRPDLTLEVVLPRGSKVDIDRLLRGRLGWVQREYDRLANSKPVLGPGAVMLGGVPLKLEFQQGAKEDLVIHDGIVTVRAADRRAVRELLRRMFLKESSAYAVRKAAELAPSLGVRPSRVDVREIGKWGYCTRRGRLSFSWQLAALPERLREYVVLHELSHLVHFDHSSAFKRTLRSVCPDFRARERELDLFVPFDRLSPPG